MNLALMKMVVRGIGKVGRTLAKMDTDVDGQGWVAKAMMPFQNGEKRWMHLLDLLISLTVVGEK